MYRTKRLNSLKYSAKYSKSLFDAESIVRIGLTSFGLLGYLLESESSKGVLLLLFIWRMRFICTCAIATSALRLSFKPLPLLLMQIKPSFVKARLFHEVEHSIARRQFYVTLDSYNRKAVLNYKIDGHIMNINSIHVPSLYKRRGIAKALTETAMTYGIVNNYYFHLNCIYVQKYYLAYKNPALRERIVGPKHIVDTSVSLDTDKFEELSDPSDDPSK